MLGAPPVLPAGPAWAAATKGMTARGIELPSQATSEFEISFSSPEGRKFFLPFNGELRYLPGVKKLYLFRPCLKGSFRIQDQANLLWDNAVCSSDESLRVRCERANVTALAVATVII